jgi:hypothetical protein
MVRYSFPVGLFHPRQHAGLSQRTLPLHVGRIVGAPTRQRHDVIDDITLSAMRVSWLALEHALGGRTPANPIVMVPRGRDGDAVGVGAASGRSGRNRKEQRQD